MIATIVIIEDNQNLVEFLKDLLKSSAEFNVEVFSSGVKAINYLKANKPHAILLDLMLEDIHGKTVCEEVRKLYSDVPIIILTGDKTSESLVACLNAGADDYITKPFNSDELLARINAKTRNINNNQSASPQVTFGDLILDTQTLEVFQNGKQIVLTPKEFELLKYLVINNFRVCTRESILFSVWGYTSEVDTRVVDVHIGKLRKKIKNDIYIKSIRGHGYRIMDHF